MLADYLLPGAVVLLKLFFRLYVGHSANKVDIAKAILAFPIDLIFLALSFSAIILGYMQSRVTNPLSTKEALGIFAIVVVSAGIVSLLARKSDDAFVIDEHLIAILWSAPAYFLSVLAVIINILAWSA